MQDALRTHAIQVSGSVGPLAQLSLVSKHISSLYRILDVRVHFPAGCANLVQVYLMLCQDPEPRTTGLPPGTSILSVLSTHSYLLGDDVTLALDIDLPVDVKGTWLKAHVVNGDGFAHSVSVILNLEEILEP